MKIKELKTILEQYPDDMEIWVSDQGNSEGGTKLTKVAKVLAIDAGLDGDEIDDEYSYIDEYINVKEYLKKGYLLSEDKSAVSKEIIYLNDF